MAAGGPAGEAEDGVVRDTEARPLRFLLGGHDLEMLAIRELLELTGARFHDKHLPWGAKASDYLCEIEAAKSAGETPVLIELEPDLPDLEGAVLVDHHGARAGADKPTSLHQIFDLLGLPQQEWTRWFDLVAANDRGYIPELLAIGATREEIIRIRAADRAAQGIAPEEEAQGEEAVKRLQSRAGGRLHVVELPHARTATVADRLESALGGPGYTNLLVVSPMQVNFFGQGKIIEALNRRYPSGWYGGALPERGFWGHGAPAPPLGELVQVLEEMLAPAGSGKAGRRAF